MKQDKISRRTNEALREALASILLYQITDPRLAFATVSAVEVSRDRSVAKVYVSAERGHEAEVADGLESAKGRIRSLLGGELSWRVTPELRFAIDTSLDEAERIEAALKEVPPTLAVEKDDQGYPL